MFIWAPLFFLNSALAADFACEKFQRAKLQNTNEVVTCFLGIVQIEKPAKSFTKTMLDGTAGLTLQNNKNIDALPEYISRTLINLENYDATACAVRMIGKNNFINLKKLKQVWLSNNEIDTIDSDTFDDNPLLFEIALDNNKLKVMSGRVFQNLRSLQKVTLSGNLCVNQNFDTSSKIQELPQTVSRLCKFCEPASDPTELADCQSNLLITSDEQRLDVKKPDLQPPKPPLSSQSPIDISPEQYELLQRDLVVPRPDDVDENSVAQEMIDILEGTSDLSNCVSDIKNRMELHRMLAEYEKQNRLMQAHPENYYDVVNEEYMPPLADYEQMAGFREENSPENGVYTEGGLVYVPNSRNDSTTSLLQSIMGFTRHERLDVKKPGPQPPQPPPSSQSPNEAPKLDNLNLEQLPAHMKFDEPKAKKQVRSDLDHANYSVDTEYAHVILKNPIDNWKDGLRIVQALGEMLNLQNYFTHIRVDRHEVSFRVEPNPENKTALDVAKSINDSRFKNNLSRRMSVLVLKAGVGDKVKDYENDINGTRIEEVDHPNWTMIVYMMIMLSSVLAITMCVALLLLHRRRSAAVHPMEFNIPQTACENVCTTLC